LEQPELRKRSTMETKRIGERIEREAKPLSLAEQG
jgi:hypothetical protein